MHVLLVVYAVMSAVTFAAYWIDKRRARRGHRRLSEATLHAMELFWGWPGAWLAQRALRHKSSKLRYQIVFWLIGITHAAGWLWWWSSR